MNATSSRLKAVAFAALVVGSSMASFAQAAKVDVTGKWAFAVETAAGSGTPTMTFKQDGEKLTGHYSGQLGEAELAGTVKGQDITFKFSVDAQGTMLDFVYTGAIESKDALKGKVSIVGLGDGTFTAKRQ
jgi:copper(I)-binding protein